MTGKGRGLPTYFGAFLAGGIRHPRKAKVGVRLAIK